MTYQNIRDVLALPDVLSGKLWFRPVQWAGRGYALELIGNFIYVVPFLAMQGRDWRPAMRELTSDLETVTPAQVLAENK